MAIKYFIKYYDVEGIEHRVNISSDAYEGTSTQIDGYADIKAGSVDNVDALFKGQGLTINLQADTSQTFSEFFTSEERTYRVEYITLSQTRFIGWIDPEGYYESFITGIWFIKITCLDGLSYLKNLSYVQSNGLIWTGKQSALEIITNCLERTELYMSFYTAIEIYYTGLTQTLDVLDNIYFNSERFVKDDNGETIMSCEDVLKDILQIFGASICQWQGKWFIYKINQLFSSQTINTFWYSYQGNVLGGGNRELGVSIGSEINDINIFHCNENQSIGLEKATAISRIYYKYGFLRTLNENYDLLNNGSSDILGWDVIKASAIDLIRISDTEGQIEVYDTLSGSPSIVIQNTDGMALSQGQSMAITIIAQSNDIPEPNSSLLRYAISFVPDDEPTETYWQTVDEGWGTTRENLGTWVNTFGWQTIEIESSTVLADGTVFIHIVEAYEGSVYIDSISFTLGEKNTEQIKGQVWTFENEDVTSSRTMENIEVYNGDNADEFYIGTIYKADQVTKTSTWRRNGGTEDLPIIHILGQDIMRLRQENALIFTGDVKGYLDYLSIVEIDGFNGLFCILEYNYDTRNDITSLKLKNFYGGDITNLDIGDSPVLDYGNTVKPTIIG